MSHPAECSQCGAPIRSDAPEGICPKCLMGLGLGEAPYIHLPPTTPPGQRFTAPSPSDLAPHFPQLEILELIGQGGMGAVYRARQRELDRVVALKILPPTAAEDPSFAERFSREAKTLARMNHPHVVAVYDVGQSGGYYYFVMEFVDGVNLRQAIQTRSLSAPESLAIVRQICDALDYAHGLGIVHRDIKPDNVLIDKQGRVKIADFGLAKLLSKSGADVTLTQANQAMGTPHYMAPEQLFRPRDVDHRADIYSLGVVFYELLTGELPLGRFDPPSHKIHLDVRLDEIVLKALQREPERRYQQASHVKTEIDAVHLTPAPEKPAAPSIVPDHVLRRSAAFASFFLITVAQLALLGLTWGYLSNAEWYFKKEVPYNILQGFWFGPGAVALGWLAWWWYLLVKDPRSPRGLNEFLHAWQTPHPQNRAIGLTVFIFLILWLGAVGAAFALTSSDDIHTLVFTSGFLMGPYVLWAALWQRHRSLSLPTGPASPGADLAPPDDMPREQSISWKAVVGAVLSFPFLLACGGLAIESLTTTRFGVYPALFLTGPLAAIACLLGVVAVRDIRRGRTWGLPLAVIDALVLPLAFLNAVIIFFTLMFAGTSVDLLVKSPEIPPRLLESEFSQEAPPQQRLDAINARLKIEYAHAERVERLRRNLAGIIALPLCLILNYLVASRVWRRLDQGPSPRAVG